MTKALKTLLVIVVLVCGCAPEQTLEMVEPPAALPAEQSPCQCQSGSDGVVAEILATQLGEMESRLQGEFRRELDERIALAIAEHWAKETPATDVVAPPPSITVQPAVDVDPAAVDEVGFFDSETVWRVTLSGQEPQIGPRSAAISLVVWSSIDCALCRQQGGVLDEIIKTYGDRARLVWKTHPAPQSEADELAAQAACAAHRQSHFWEYRDRFKDANGEKRTKSLFVKIASDVGLDPVRFRRDMVSGACRQHLDADRVTAAQVGVVAVPTLTVNGRKAPSVVTPELLQEIISEELAKVAAMEVEGVAAERIYDDLVADGDVQRPLSEESFTFQTAATVVGSENAAHVLTVFGDYECPYTRALFPNLDLLLAAFPNDLAVEYRHFPMPYHGAARMAAEATLEAARQGEFPRFHKGLLKLPGDFTMKQLERLTKRSRMDVKELRVALRDGRHRAVIDSNVDEARKAGVWATPSIFIDGHRYLSPDRSFEALEALLKER
jgi:protein-disulfide isomerase